MLRQVLAVISLFALLQAASVQGEIRVGSRCELSDPQSCGSHQVCQVSAKVGPVCKCLADFVQVNEECVETMQESTTVGVTESEGPTTTGGPTESEGPTTTGGPTESEGPTTTGGPTESEGPTTTGGPTESEGPTTTGGPTESEGPTTTGEPGENTTAGVDGNVSTSLAVLTINMVLLLSV